MEFIEAKTILQKVIHGDQWFGIDYSINLYKGCSHGCIYCDSRCNCYGIENFDVVRGKKNEIEILEKELASKRKKGVVGIGSMSDTYNPFEKQFEITRNALKLIRDYGFGISLETKSNLIERDIDVLKEINLNSNVIIKFTITTTNDELCKKIEPHVCSSSKRFETMKKLSDAGIFTGTLLMPVIPFITDSDENIKNIIKKTYESGGKFVFSMGFLSLRDNQRHYFYNKLDSEFPGLKKKYMECYPNNYECYSKNRNLEKVFIEECKRYGLLYEMHDIINEYKKNVSDGNESYKNLDRLDQLSMFNTDK